MTARERMLAGGALVTAIIVASGILFKVLFLDVLSERNKDVAALQKDVQDKQEHVNLIRADLPKLARWKRISLPENKDKAFANREYANYLGDLMRESAFAPGSFTITPGKQVQARNVPMIGKAPVYQKLDYAVQVHTSLENLVTFLEHFYRTNLLHQIKGLTIQRPLTPGPGQQATDLDINFTVEALIIDGAEKREQLLPGASPKRAAQFVGLNAVLAAGGGPASIVLFPEAYGPLGNDTLARTREQYAAMADKNIFLGFVPKQRAAQEVTVTRFVRLNNITRNERRAEAHLWNRYDNKWIRLRAETGFDYFRIMSEKGDNTLVRGKVVRIDDREVIFKVDDNYYSVHVDQTLEEAMKKPLSSEQRKDRGLASAADKTVAK